jgi:NTP pyrophosphatase (non-canonical NTP hydrolase)
MSYLTRIQHLQNVISKWSDETFGKHPNRKNSLANHLKEEVLEVTAAVWADKPTNVKCELADCLILMLDLAAKYQIDASALLHAAQEKMVQNMNSEWGEPDQYGIIHRKK